LKKEKRSCYTQEFLLRITTNRNRRRKPKSRRSYKKKEMRNTNPGLRKLSLRLMRLRSSAKSRMKRNKRSVKRKRCNSSWIKTKKNLRNGDRKWTRMI